MTLQLGIDLGATTVRAAVAEDGETILGRGDRPTPNGPDGDSVADAVCDVAVAACRDAGIDSTRVEYAATAAFAEVDRERGGVVSPANLSADVEFVPLVDRLSSALTVDDVALLNDATAGAIGERASRDAEDLVYLSLSTGIGAGVVVDGRALEGQSGNAGEVGHVELDPEGRLPCGCGGTGHWEAYCGGENLPRYARYLADECDVDTDLPLDSVEAADLFAAADEDPLANRLLERVADWNARGVAAVVCAYDPAVVVFGGAVALENPQRVIDPIRKRLPSLLQFGPLPELRLSAVGDDAVLYGALRRAAGDR